MVLRMKIKYIFIVIDILFYYFIYFSLIENSFLNGMYFIFNNIKEGSMNVDYLMINLNKFLNCLVGDCVMK